MKKNKIVACVYVSLIIGTNMFLNVGAITDYVKAGIFGNTNKEFSILELTTNKCFASSSIDASWMVINEASIDPTTAISAKAALNVVINNSIAKGNTKFYIENGTYNLTGPIIINHSNITISGESKEGTQLIQTNSDSKGIEITANNDKADVSDLTIDNTLGKEAFYCYNSNNVSLKNSIIKGSATNSAIFLNSKLDEDTDINLVESNNLNYGNHIEGNIIYSTVPEDGVFFNKQKDALIDGNTITGSGLSFYLCRNSSVSNNLIKDTLTNGIRCASPSYDNKILNNTIQNTKKSGISLIRYDQGIVPNTYRASNFTISGNHISNTRYFGIEISNLKNSEISNNIVEKVDFHGIYLLYSDYLNINSNTVRDCNLFTINGKAWPWDERFDSGIFGDYKVTNSSINYNKIINNGNVSPYGIRIQPDPSNHDNDIENNTINGYFESAIDIKIGDTTGDTSIEDGNNKADSNTAILLPIPSPPAGDTTAPTIPTELTLSAITSSGFTLTWTASTDDVGVTEYEIYNGGVLVGTTAGVSYNITGLSPSTTYNFTIKAKDAAGNKSDESANLAVTTLAAPLPPPQPADTTPPITPVLSKDAETSSSVRVSIGNWGDAIVKKYSIDGGQTWLDYTSPIIITANITIIAKGQDAAGNWSGVGTLTISDIRNGNDPNNKPLNPPKISADVSTPTNKDVTVEISDWGDAIARKYSIDDGNTWLDYTKPIIITNNVTIIAKGQDKNGNWSDIGTFIVKNIDKIAPSVPSISFTSPLGYKGGYTTENVIASISDGLDNLQGSGLNKYQYSIDGGIVWNDLSGSTITFSNKINGDLVVRSIDNAGNIGAISTKININIDDKVSSSSGSSGGAASVSVHNNNKKIKRLWGKTKIDTAIAIARETYGDKFENVVIVSGDNFPDGLSGCALASKINAPILLVGNTIEDSRETLNYIYKSLPVAGKVYILGGYSVVSNDIEKELIGKDYVNVKRLGGLDRYNTNSLIANEINVEQGTPVIIASGEGFPDELSASSTAASKGYPILLTEKYNMPKCVEENIIKVKPKQVYVLGSEGAIDDKVVEKLKNVTGLNNDNIIRISGRDRYETSAKIANYFNLGEKVVTIASGENFPDALTGSIYAAKNKAAILLVNGENIKLAKEYINKGKFDNIVIFGGAGVVQKDIEDELGK